MNRRQFIKLLGGSALGLLALPIVKAVEADIVQEKVALPLDMWDGMTTATDTTNGSWCGTSKAGRQVSALSVDGGHLYITLDNGEILAAKPTTIDNSTFSVAHTADWDWDWYSRDERVLYGYSDFRSK